METDRSEPPVPCTPRLLNHQESCRDPLITLDSLESKRNPSPRRDWVPLDMTRLKVKMNSYYSSLSNKSLILFILLNDPKNT